jgi:hypothetical protein
MLLELAEPHREARCCNFSSYLRNGSSDFCDCKAEAVGLAETLTERDLLCLLV